MRIPGKTFIESYLFSLKINKALGNEGLEEHLMKWSTDVVDQLKTTHQAEFEILIKLQPTSIKTNNSVTIEIWESPIHDDGELTPYEKPFMRFSSTHHKISDCIKEINNTFEHLEPEEIIEKDGKKYRLVEIKN